MPNDENILPAPGEDAAAVKSWRPPEGALLPGAWRVIATMPGSEAVRNISSNGRCLNGSPPALAFLGTGRAGAWFRDAHAMAAAAASAEVGHLPLCLGLREEMELALDPFPPSLPAGYLAGWALLSALCLEGLPRLDGVGNAAAISDVWSRLWGQVSVCGAYPLHRSPSQC